MGRWACLLRAVNVGGQRKLKMTELQDLCTSLGCTEVVTYMQSGNVVLSSKQSQSRIGPALSAAISQEMGYSDVDVLVWSAAELAVLIRDNPFLATPGDASGMHVTFLSKNAKASQINALGPESYLPDRFAAGRNAVYVHCPNGYGRTKLNNSFFERKLNVAATTRNWQTVKNLHSLLSE